MKVTLTFDGKRTLYVSSPEFGTKIFQTGGEKLEDGEIEILERWLFT